MIFQFSILILIYSIIGQVILFSYYSFHLLTHFSPTQEWNAKQKPATSFAQSWIFVVTIRRILSFKMTNVGEINTLKKMHREIRLKNLWKILNWFFFGKYFLQCVERNKNSWSNITDWIKRQNKNAHNIRTKPKKKPTSEQ